MKTRLIPRLRAITSLVAAMLVVIAFSWTSASAQWPMQYGDIVITCQGTCGDPNAFVMGTVNVQNWNLPANMNNASWLSNPSLMYHHPSWTRQNLGDIFGVCIDNSANIYVTATAAYYDNAWCPSSTGPGGPGAIYKINGVTGAISTFATLPQSSIAPGLGNIAYDPVNNQFFVTNFEDGKIYRVNSVGVAVPFLDPFAPDGGSPGPAPVGERLWGIGVYNGRVYFARWNEDRINYSPSVGNEIWSVPVSGGSPTLEVTTTALGCPSGSSSPISDIAFSSGGRMAVAERGNETYSTGSNHYARFLEFYPPAWAPAPPYSTYNLKYNPSVFVFCPPTYANSSGGLDYGYERPSADGTPEKCDSVLWMTMDYGSGHLTGISATTGGAIAQSVWKNLGVGKNQVGDVETYRPVCGAQVHDSCEGLSVKVDSITQHDKLCCANITLGNSMPNFFTQVTATVITPGAILSSVAAPSGWGASAAGNTVTFTPTGGYIPVGSASGFKICVFNMAPPPTTIVLTWFGKNGSLCRDTIRMDCRTEKPPIPQCDSLTNVKIECKEISMNGAYTYQMTFSVVNLNPFMLPAENIDVAIMPAGLLVSPTSFTFAPVPYGGTAGPFVVNITGPGAVSGTNFCLLIKLYGHKDTANPCCYSWCCPQDTFCFTLPPCEDCCEEFSSRFSPVPTPPGTPLLQYNGSGGVSLNTMVTALPGPWISASVSIVSATVQQQCQGKTPNGNVYGTITGGTANWAGLSGPVFAIPPIPGGGSHEVHWGVTPAGVPISNLLLKLNMKFPPPPSAWPPPFGCRDTLRFCLRFRFTDKECRTCDTLVCYELVRRAVIDIGPVLGDVGHFIKRPTSAVTGNPADAAGKGNDDPSLQGLPGEPSSPLEARIVMSSSTDGVMSLALASANPDDPATIVGLKMEPSTGMNIVTMTDDGSGATASVVDHVASINTSIAEGSSATFTLKYENALDQKTFINWLLIRYVTRDNTADTLEGEIVVRARTPGGMGGDTLTRDLSQGTQRKDVRTYALTFTNGNKTDDSIAAVVIQTKAPARILAVGPGTDSMLAVLRSYTVGSPDSGSLLSVPSDNRAVVSQVGPGSSIGPIYVTVAGAVDDSTTIEYQSLDADGNIVSAGTIILTEPVSASRRDDHPISATAVTLSNAVPNPLDQTTMVRFTLPTHEANVQLVLSDVLGREVKSVFESKAFEAGEHNVTINCADLPVGTYYFTLRTDTQSQTRKMVVAR